MKPIILDMTYLKSTKNTHVYKSHEDFTIPTLYIKRSAFDGKEPPNLLKITIIDMYEQHDQEGSEQ